MKRIEKGPDVLPSDPSPGRELWEGPVVWVPALPFPTEGVGLGADHSTRGVGLGADHSPQQEAMAHGIGTIARLSPEVKPPLWPAQIPPSVCTRRSKN